MNVLLIMLPGAVVLAAVALGGLIWSLKSGQFEDPAGDAARVLLDDDRPG